MMTYFFAYFIFIHTLLVFQIVIANIDDSILVNHVKSLFLSKARYSVT